MTDEAGLSACKLLTSRFKKNLDFPDVGREGGALTEPWWWGGLRCHERRALLGVTSPILSTRGHRVTCDDMGKSGG